MAFLPVLEISDILSTIVFVMVTSGLSDLLAHQPVEPSGTNLLFALPCSTTSSCAN